MMPGAGISASRHRRPAVPARFRAGRGIEVKAAWLDNGLLHVDLARPQPESRVRTIQIGKQPQSASRQSAAAGLEASRSRHNGGPLSGPETHKAGASQIGGPPVRRNDERGLTHPEGAPRRDRPPRQASTSVICHRAARAARCAAGRLCEADHRGRRPGLRNPCGGWHADGGRRKPRWRSRRSASTTCWRPYSLSASAACRVGVIAPPGRCSGPLSGSAATRRVDPADMAVAAAVDHVQFAGRAVAEHQHLRRRDPSASPPRRPIGG